MSKRARSTKKKKAESAEASEQVVQLPLPVIQTLMDTQQNLHRFLIETGMQVVEAMLASEQAEICGERYRHQTGRKAYRHGSEMGLMTLGGQKVRIKKPRARTVDGEEIPLTTWKGFQGEDPMSLRVMEQVCVGVPMRKYERSLETPADLETVATKKSSVSRRFVVKSREVAQEFLGRSLEGLDIPIVMIDGTRFGKRVLIVVMGIDGDGRKHVLGIREGSTESSEVCKSLFRDLIARGLEVETPRLFIIDGSKALHSAIDSLFAGWSKIQRCQIHKMRNVMEHLPEGHQSWVKTRLRSAFRSPSAEKGQQRARRLISDLQVDYPGAASSIEEGLSEMFTLTRLGLSAPSPLWTSLRSTNAIENLQGSLKYTAKNVKRWRNGMMVIRWAVTGAMEAEKKFRRIRGYKQIPTLIEALSHLLAAERSAAADNSKQVA